MPIIKYVEPGGALKTADVEAGDTVMQGAMDNLIEGMLAECGGACSCGTCHCYVDEEWSSKIAPADEMEIAMLKFVDNRQENSRLGCQITVAEGYEGLIVHMPESMY